MPSSDAWLVSIRICLETLNTAYLGINHLKIEKMLDMNHLALVSLGSNTSIQHFVSWYFLSLLSFLYVLYPWLAITHADNYLLIPFIFKIF